MRLAFGPVRAAARSSRELLADEAERAFEAALSGPLPETFGRLLAEHGVVERVVAGMLEGEGGPDADRAERLAERLSSGETGRVVEAYAARLAQSDAIRDALTEILSGPEVRRALTRQTSGYTAELATGARHRARALDDAVEVKARRVVGLGAIDHGQSFGGLASRGTGLVIDAALVQLGFTVLVGAIGLVAALAGGLHAGWIAGTLAGAGWLLIGAVYFVAFWSGTGQTPGMRVMRVRVLTTSGGSLSVRRSLVRFVGLILAIAPLFLGFLPVPFDRRRRALPDFLAGTVVVCEPAESAV
jgi:uncharacterized RDD family membrane protein YckC